MNPYWRFETQSWLFILLFAGMILIPVWMTTGFNYTFYFENIISIIVFLSFTKYIFLLRFTPYARMKWVKFAAVFLCIPVFLLLIDNLFDFQRFVDENGTISFFRGSTDLSDYNFGKFIKYQFILFTVAALVSTVFLPVRLIMSFWRVRNTKDQV
ncbi:MAG: hypothetical protein IPM26_05135 [Saprospiraceae bacterium]|nr:hypothetical protein [Saprospiraceae bacterium]